MKITDLIKRKIYNALHPKIGEVWMLHRVVEHRSEKPEQHVLEVTPDFLEQKILKYQQKGYRFVSINELPSLITAHYSPFTPRFVCITFDDGYRDNYTVAYPLLKSLGVPFTIYVTTGFIDNKQPMWWYPGQSLALDLDELCILAEDPLCTIGAHTVNHPHLSQLPIDAQLNEIQTSQHQLQAILNRPIAHFSYPHGDYNDQTLNICRQIGFHTAVTTNGRTVRTNYQPLQLDRINIVQPD